MGLLAYVRRKKYVPPPAPTQVHLPIPMEGDDTISGGTLMSPSNTIYSYNVIPAELGLRTRLGWREWVTGLDGPVLSLLPYTGSTKDGANNRQFACTKTGIWDVSASTDAPTQVVTFPTQNDDSGWGVSTVFVNAAGNHFLCYCDEANGYYVYSETGAGWTAGGLSGSPITGVDPSRLVAVTPWKNRLWFIERDTARAWYLDIGAVTGAANAFNFGARFKAGGDLRTLASWTFDGGSGIDDALVAVSGGGDVVIYKGTDPSSASTFALSGVWYVGAVPAGRRLTTDFGGDLLVMSSIGIMPLSKLVIGNIVLDRSQYQTFRIANLFNQLMANTAGLRGWAMRLHPQDNALMVLTPTAENQPTQQLVMSLLTKGWHRYRDMPVGVCAEPWAGTMYFGTEDGRVCANDGYVDGVTLASPDSYTPITFSLLTAFQNLGSPAQKRIHLLRPTVNSQGGAVSLKAQARYQWDMSEIAEGLSAEKAPGAAWDSAIWDVSTFAGDYQPQSPIFGASGMGPIVAIAIKGASTSRMSLVGVDVEFDAGGYL